MEDEKKTESKAKNVGGRPRKKTKRETKMGFNATAVEHTLIQEKAKRAGLRPADYLRDLALKGKPRPMPSPEQLQLYRDITGIANNLNQLTKEAHKQNLPALAGRVLKTLDETAKTLKSIRDHQN